MTDEHAEVARLVAEGPVTRNSEVLDSFVKYCETRPELRFWQALRAWSECGCILVGREGSELGFQDTYYWEGRKEHP